MKKIFLTQYKFTIVDDFDYTELSKYRWYTHKKKNTCYAVRNIYDPITKKQTLIGMHNQILNIKGIDHINGNGLDNQRDNLRPATKNQNGMNRCKEKNVSSQFKGVYKTIKKYKDKTYYYWEAKIGKNNIRIYLGNFKSEFDAASAYNVKAKEFFGEYARLNKVIT